MWLKQNIKCHKPLETNPLKNISWKSNPKNSRRKQYDITVVHISRIPSTLLPFPNLLRKLLLQGLNQVTQWCFLELGVTRSSVGYVKGTLENHRKPYKVGPEPSYKQGEITPHGYPFIFGYLEGLSRNPTYDKARDTPCIGKITTPPFNEGPKVIRMSGIGTSVEYGLYWIREWLHPLLHGTQHEGYKRRICNSSI